MFRNPLTDAVVVLVIVLLFFGPKRLPSLARALGESMREFRGSIGAGHDDEETERPAITPAPAHEPSATDAAAAKSAPVER